MRNTGEKLRTTTSPESRPGTEIACFPANAAESKAAFEGSTQADMRRSGCIAPVAMRPKSRSKWTFGAPQRDCSRRPRSAQPLSPGGVPARRLSCRSMHTAARSGHSHSVASCHRWSSIDFPSDSMRRKRSWRMSHPRSWRAGRQNQRLAATIEWKKVSDPNSKRRHYSGVWKNLPHRSNPGQIVPIDRRLSSKCRRKVCRRTRLQRWQGAGS